MTHILPFGECFYRRSRGAISIYVNEILNNSKGNWRVIEPDQGFIFLKRFWGLRRLARYSYYRKVALSIDGGAKIVIHNDVAMYHYLLSRIPSDVEIYLHFHNVIDGHKVRSDPKLKKVFFCSLYIKNNFEFSFANDSGAELEVHYNGIYNRETSSFERRTIDYAFVGRFDVNKGVDKFFPILRKEDRAVVVKAHSPISYYSIKFTLISYIYSVLRWGRFKFLCNESHTHIQILLENVKVLIVPTQYREAFGMVILEGIAAGCLVASSDVGGIPEVDPIAGSLFDGPFPDRDRLLELIQEKDKYLEVRTRQRARLESFSWPDLAKKIESSILS